MRHFSIGLAALVALSLASTAEARKPPKGARYVAMGSSSAAGTGIGGIKPGTPRRCGRSASNYATLLAGKLSLSLDDQTCGGATTAHILGPWSELPPQIDAVNAQTLLVTVQIGSNDLGFVPSLYAANCRNAAATEAKCGTPRIPTAEDYARLETNLRNIAEDVARRAPKARLIFVQFLKFVPDSPCAESKLNADDAIAMRQVGDRLAAIIKRVAASERIDLLPAYALSRNHSHCDAEPWSAGAVTHAPLAPATWHPNAAGHAAVAAALERMLRR